MCSTKCLSLWVLITSTNLKPTSSILCNSFNKKYHFHRYAILNQSHILFSSNIFIFAFLNFHSITYNANFKSTCFDCYFGLVQSFKGRCGRCNRRVRWDTRCNRWFACLPSAALRVGQRSLLCSLESVWQMSQVGWRLGIQDLAEVYDISPVIQSTAWLGLITRTWIGGWKACSKKMRMIRYKNMV